MSAYKLDAKKLLKEHGEKGTKIKYRDRVELEIVKETKHYKVGQRIRPHKVLGDQLLKDKVAKKATKKD